MAKKAKKKAKSTREKKPKAKAPMPPMPKKKTKKSSGSGAKKNPYLKGAANSEFVKEVMTPVEVPKPIEPKLKAPSTGQASGTRLERITGTSVLGFEQMRIVKVPTNVTKKRVTTYLIV